TGRLEGPAGRRLHLRAGRQASHLVSTRREGRGALLRTVPQATEPDVESGAGRPPFRRGATTLIRCGPQLSRVFPGNAAIGPRTRRNATSRRTIPVPITTIMTRAIDGERRKAIIPANNRTRPR